MSNKISRVGIIAFALIVPFTFGALTAESREANTTAREDNRALMLQRATERKAVAEENRVANRERVESVRLSIQQGQITTVDQLSRERERILEERRQITKERIAQTVINMAEALRRDHGRLSNIADRLESRISRDEEEGKNTQVARRLLSEAREHLSKADEKLGAVSQAIDEIRNSDNTREAYQRARATVLDARRELRGARTALREALRVVKNLSL